MTLAAPDRPGLFASAAGTLSGFGLNILRAEAFANRRGMVLDTFTFADPMRNLELNPTEVDRLRSTAERVITGRTGREASCCATAPSPPRPAARRASPAASASIPRPAAPPPSSRSSPKTAPACSTTWPPPSPPTAPISRWS